MKSNRKNFNLYTGAGLSSLEHFKLNENRLVLCDDFFHGILAMSNLKVLDVKNAIMPCPCEIKNGTNLFQAFFGMVLDNGSECFIPDSQLTSTAIGNVNYDLEEKYTYKRIITKAQATQTCYQKSEFSAKVKGVTFGFVKVQ